jgi:hypothetical protein
MNYHSELIIIIMMSTIRDKKGKEIWQKGTAFRMFANFDEPNLSHREYMEDCTSHAI